MVDLLSDSLNAIKVAELKGKKECNTANTKLVRSVLQVLKEAKYIEEFKENGRKIDVTLNGSINNCGAIKPRFFTKYPEWEKYETRYLPSKDIGLIIVSTPQGVIAHTSAKTKTIGGALLAFVY